MDIETNVLDKGIVVVRDGVSQIVLYDHLTPEESAMALSLFSRDPRSVLVHLDQIAKVGPEKFMGQFYVGYGHKSIGDCGTTNVCFENVSLLAAKAIQDWALYNGQEASTRYLNMGAQPLIDPIGSSESKSILDEWMNLYRKILEELIPLLAEKYSYKPDQDEKEWGKAIKAKAFDIARGFLPAGISTYVGWHSNLRQAHDHIQQLEHFPLVEVQTLAKRALTGLQRKYPSSFSHKKYPEQEAYLAKMGSDLTYFDFDINRFKATSRLDPVRLARYTSALSERPQKTELPAVIRNAGDIIFEFLLDFGSYRDLQRQRSVVLPLPLLTTRHGFHDWYLHQLGLSSELRAHALEVLAQQEKRIADLPVSDEVRQYYIALGYKVACEMTANLPASVYVAELRAGQTVHPTLRVVAQEMGNYLEETIPGIKMYHDCSPDAWNIKRGKQDIVKKE